MPDRPRDPEDDRLQEEAEPNTTGTVFLTLLLLMMIFGFWTMMYVMLLER